MMHAQVDPTEVAALARKIAAADADVFRNQYPAYAADIAGETGKALDTLNNVPEHRERNDRFVADMAYGEASVRHGDAVRQRLGQDRMGKPLITRSDHPPPIKENILAFPGTSTYYRLEQRPNTPEAPMSPTTTINQTLLDTVLGRLAVLFLTGAAGDPTAAHQPPPNYSPPTTPEPRKNSASPPKSSVSASMRWKPSARPPIRICH
jgi:hypothetical protein